MVDNLSNLSVPRILFLGINSSGWFFQNLWHLQQKILNLMPGSIIYGPGFQYTNNYVPEIISERFGDCLPDAVFCFITERRLLGEPFDEAHCRRYGLEGDLTVFPRGLKDTKLPKIMWITDFWSCTRDEWDHILLGNGFDFALSTCCPPFGSRAVFDRFFSQRVQEAVRFVPWPHSISTELFRDYGLPKLYDVTLLGLLAEKYYPLRTAMAKAFADERAITYFSNAHPGYDYISSTEALVGEAYAKVLNQSRIFASCTGIYGIAFQKIYEAMASKAVMLCDRPYGAEYLGFIDRENYLVVTENNFIEVAKHYLRYPDELDRISANGRSLVENCHSVDVRAAEFRDTITSLICREEPTGWAELFDDCRRTDRQWLDVRDAVIAKWRIYRTAKRHQNAIMLHLRSTVSRILRRLRHLVGISRSILPINRI
ncbi:glycosyltransferase [bacterium]|nr:glycosyltransferase [bacterium]